MKRSYWVTFVAAALLLVFSIGGTEQPSPTSDIPQFTSEGQLVRPQHYREWIFLSSGLGMNYGPAAAESRESNPLFDNVFVSRAAWNVFRQTGTWPDKTVLVLEIRSSQSKGSINQNGRFQNDVVGVEVEVKDEMRYPGKWAFFDFGGQRASAKPLPADASCYSCHAKNGAVDNTFVQFYPTLFNVAKEKGTLKAASTELEATQPHAR